MKEFVCRSLDDTKEAAKYFATFAKAGQCFALTGDLGSGKTTFSQFLIQTLMPSVEYVSSPTFTIVQTYNSENQTEIWHVDCYRLKDREEFFELGLQEAFETCITIIEWPKIIDEFLPQNTIKITFSVNKIGDRLISSNK
ncbi:MAG: tRNA (adenosine(37)-N6)-threonylcarbamoyltransferase complex ATPase subunit type 1 TsaE [Alphaproteobacteria bacterium]|nr:tRNA (adenosine(37)-N6)-threonylcarbamoyltransferase complex ATPase subunit type 1 TsaE [Alphaproteobacteria bacterium]